MFGRREYHRFLPHYQSDQHTYFVTLVTRQRYVLPPIARDIVLRQIVSDHEKRMHLRVSTVMPDHAHLIFMPLWNARGDTYSIGEIVRGIKVRLRGTSIWLSAGQVRCGYLSPGIERSGVTKTCLKKRSTYL